MIAWAVAIIALGMLVCTTIGLFFLGKAMEGY